MTYDPWTKGKSPAFVKKAPFAAPVFRLQAAIGGTLRKLELGLAAVLFLFAIPLCAQDPLPKPSILSGGTYGVPVGRTFLPHNWIRGFTEMEVAPSHNEPDLGRCAGPAADFGGIHAPCTDYARYMLSGYIEIQPIGRTALRHIFLFYVPRFSFGRNVPRNSAIPATFPRSLTKERWGLAWSCQGILNSASWNIKSIGLMPIRSNPSMRRRFGDKPDPMAFMRPPGLPRVFRRLWPHTWRLLAQRHAGATRCVGGNVHHVPW